MPDKYQTINSKEIWRGHIFSVRVDDVRMPAGNVVDREILSHAGSVAIVPLTAENNVVLVRQYRHPIRDYLLEIPAGKLDRVELPEECAKRELLEEIGASCESLIKLTGFYFSPGYSDEFGHIYLANVGELGEMSPDGDEELDMERVIIPLDEAVKMIGRGEIIDSKSIIGLLMTAGIVKEKG